MGDAQLALVLTKRSATSIKRESAPLHGGANEFLMEGTIR
jgi:hypothetical protein